MAFYDVSVGGRYSVEVDLAHTTEIYTGRGVKVSLRISFDRKIMNLLAMAKHPIVSKRVVADAMEDWAHSTLRNEVDRDFQRKMKQLSKRKGRLSSGLLLSTYRVERSGSNVAVKVGGDIGDETVVYAALKEFGGTVHPRRRKMLVFEEPEPQTFDMEEGSKWKLRSAHHPPYHFMRDSVRATKDKLLKMVKSALINYFNEREGVRIAKSTLQPDKRALKPKVKPKPTKPVKKKPKVIRGRKKPISGRAVSGGKKVSGKAIKGKEKKTAAVTKRVTKTIVSVSKRVTSYEKKVRAARRVVSGQIKTTAGLSAFGRIKQGSTLRVRVGIRVVREFTLRVTDRGNVVVFWKQIKGGKITTGRTTISGSRPRMRRRR
jgi:hypothetical protein